MCYCSVALVYTVEQTLFLFSHKGTNDFMLTGGTKFGSSEVAIQLADIQNASTFDEQKKHFSQFLYQGNYSPNSAMAQDSTLWNIDRFVCARCGRSYMRKCTLQRHTRLECGKEPGIHCPVCPYRTKRSDELRKHMRRTHNVDKKWECSLDIEFLDEWAFIPVSDQSIDTEFGLPSVKENEVDNFSLSTNYSHLIEKGELFTHQGNITEGSLQENDSSLDSFQNQPNAAIRFRCENCGKTYMWKSTLLRHMKQECGKEPNVRCPICPYKTKRTDELKKHLKRAHDIILKRNEYFSIL
ncbi:hypothetical protein C0J52_13314 [Blattella germanica]|nr:hypothetical protein C0J52_13314 [Blattella germanica]